MQKQKYDYLIIGGGIAGVTAAEIIREHDTNGSIAVISEEPRVLYSRVLLPAYLKKKITRDRLFLRTADNFIEKRIDLLLGQTITAVDSAHHEAICGSGDRMGYGKLLLACGGDVRPWGDKEIQPWIYRLQTLDDADRLFVALPSLKNPLVVGSSFISLEFLEIFVAQGIVPALMARAKHFFGDVLDEEGGQLLQENFEQHGIRAHFGEEVEDVVVRDGSLDVITKKSGLQRADALAVGIGLERAISFLEGSGIAIGAHGIRTNEFLETSQLDVYAAGDAAEFYDIIFHTHRAQGTWTNSFLQGKHAGLVMTGMRQPFRHVSAYSLTNLGFQITIVGDCGDRRETIVRSDFAKKQYERFFLRDDALVGAVLINRFADKAPLVRLIETAIPISTFRASLRDLSFDLGDISVLP